MAIEETFKAKTIEALENLEFEDEEDETVRITQLITDLQVRAYAMGKMTEDVDQDDDEEVINYDPKFDYANIEFVVEPSADSSSLVNCFDCGSTLNTETLAIHQNFHIELNKVLKTNVTGYIKMDKDLDD